MMRRTISLVRGVSVILECGSQLTSRAKCVGVGLLYFWDADGIPGAYDLTLVLPFVGITLRMGRGA